MFSLLVRMAWEEHMEKKRHTTASGEDYLEAILVLQKKMGMVRPVDIARHMGFTKPSITHAITTLQAGGFVERDEDGFMRGKPGDWVFIDWAPMDKTGALCGGQILFAKAMECYAAISEVIGRDDRGLGGEAKKLRGQIFEKFYDAEKRVFIDSYESGKRNVSRQSNILAYLFLGCDDTVKKDKRIQATGYHAITKSSANTKTQTKRHIRLRSYHTPDLKHTETYHTT